MLSFASQSSDVQTQGKLFSFRFYPKPTGDPGQDRHARTLQFACFLLAVMVGTFLALDIVASELSALPILCLAMTGLVGAVILSRQGVWKWAGWTAFLSILLTGVLLVVQARDGFRSLAMLLFPALLLICVMLLDRAFYIATAASILITVAALGIAEMHGLTGAIPGVRSPTTYEAILHVDLILLVFAIIGSRFAANARSNVSDLRMLISRLSATNLELTESARALRESEAALRESEERFRRVFEEGPLGVALVGKDYRFVKVNRALCQMVGYPESLLVQKSFAEITHPEDVAADMELAERLFKREIPFYRMQKRYLKRNGEIIWINLTASNILGPDGEPLYGLAMMEDITEIKRAHEEALFRQKLESVGTLAGGIAHDFNNLLGAVQAQAELASAELAAGSSCQEQLNAIREVTTRGSEIVRQLMIYAGTDSASVGPVDLSKIVDEMLSLLKVSVTKRAVIKTNLYPDLPFINASAAQLRQVVMNLITNASDAIGDRDGVISVITKRVHVEEKSATTVSGTLPEGSYVQLEVSDTGRGISRETQAKVFDPFFTTKSAGRGLGLAVVQGIVRNLGGAIYLSSESGKGTTFRVLLPCAEITADTRAKSGTEEVAVPSARGTVLVVEDEQHLCQAVATMLRKRGFEVVEAADGSSAIDVLHTVADKIDVILLDMTIPGPSSREVVEAANINPKIKVILTSAYSQEIIAGAMNHPQIDSFIRKPYQFNDLLKTVRNCLSS